jgi:hypothetical protein
MDPSSGTTVQLVFDAVVIVAVTWFLRHTTGSRPPGANR